MQLTLKIVGKYRIANIFLRRWEVVKNFKTIGGRAVTGPISGVRIRFIIFVFINSPKNSYEYIFSLRALGLFKVSGFLFNFLRFFLMSNLFLRDGPSLQCLKLRFFHGFSKRAKNIIVFKFDKNPGININCYENIFGFDYLYRFFEKIHRY